ncbi:hypothetical protein PR048_023550 [Dryococelus australis]|uniref:Transposase n=1 Tax=Dryococelus australis TaxID=614101 RepID=A0ABQ9GUE3_9NEOP|nr:hypothetical protein PR048_023550 [Dryococelus australis]
MSREPIVRICMGWIRHFRVQKLRIAVKKHNQHNERRNAKAGEMGDFRENPPTSENLGVARPGIGHGSPWLEANSLTAQPRRPRERTVFVERRVVPDFIPGTRSNYLACVCVWRTRRAVYRSTASSQGEEGKKELTMGGTRGVLQTDIPCGGAVRFAVPSRGPGRPWQGQAPRMRNGPVYLEMFSTFEAEKCSSDKGDNATCFECVIAVIRKALNWHTVFSWYCVYPLDVNVTSVIFSSPKGVLINAVALQDEEDKIRLQVPDAVFILGCCCSLSICSKSYQQHRLAKDQKNVVIQNFTDVRIFSTSKRRFGAPLMIPPKRCESTEFQVKAWRRYVSESTVNTRCTGEECVIRMMLEPRKRKRTDVIVFVADVISAICRRLLHILIPVPSENAWRANAAEFWERWQFPNCVGAVDGKHVQIVCPSNTTTLPGSDKVVPFVIIGVEAFRLHRNLMKPCKKTQAKEDFEKAIFNYRLTRARRVSENAFDLPAMRIQQVKSFAKDGVDYAGPFTVKLVRVRHPGMQTCKFMDTFHEFTDSNNVASGLSSHHTLQQHLKWQEENQPLRTQRLVLVKRGQASSAAVALRMHQ